MPRTKLLDRGEEICEIYPEVRVRNRQGSFSLRPGKTPEVIRVTVTEERMSASDLIGQVSIHYLRLSTRHMRGGAYARVVFRGEEWDIVTPPHLSTGSSRAIRHWEFKIRSRNRLGEEPQGG